MHYGTHMSVLFGSSVSLLLQCANQKLRPIAAPLVSTWRSNIISDKCSVQALTYDRNTDIRTYMEVRKQRL